MGIVRFDPIRGWTGTGRDAARGTWVPPVDIYETADKTLVLKAELPEMKREDIAVTVERGTLTISGDRAWPADVAREGVQRVERPYGRFTRRFALPGSVDTAQVAADYRDGVLTVRLPAREAARPRTIPVAVAS
ncbi:MAG: Hsp20/alpha crystallin family protein [Vicinamibacterales bacterium]